LEFWSHTLLQKICHRPRHHCRIVEFERCNWRLNLSRSWTPGIPNRPVGNPNVSIASDITIEVVVHRAGVTFRQSLHRQAHRIYAAAAAKAYGFW